MRGWGPNQLFAVIALMFVTASCVGEHKAGLFNGVALIKYAPAGNIIPGSIYRTFLPNRIFSSLGEVRPICTRDTAAINAQALSEQLSDIDIILDRKFLLTLVAIEFPGFPRGFDVDLVETVRVQISGVRRYFLEESESARTTESLGVACRNVLEENRSADKIVYLVEGVVIAKQARFVITYKASRPASLDLNSVTVNGLTVQTVSGNATVHVGADAIVELFTREF